MRLDMDARTRRAVSRRNNQTRRDPVTRGLGMPSMNDDLARAVAARKWTRESGCTFAEYQGAALCDIDPRRYGDTSARRYMLQYKVRQRDNCRNKPI